MQPNFIRLVDGIDDALVVTFVGHEIKTVGVDQQDAHVPLLLTEKIKLTLLNIVKIGIADFLLVAAPTLADVGLQSLHIGIKVHQQFRLWHV